MPALSPMRIALTLVHLGLDLGSIITRTTMAKGLAFALARLGLEVVPRHAAPPRAADRHPDGVLVVEDDQLTG